MLYIITHILFITIISNKLCCLYFYTITSVIVCITTFIKKISKVLLIYNFMLCVLFHINYTLFYKNLLTNSN